MVTEALKTLAPGGRLVAIVSGGHPAYPDSVGMGFDGSQQVQNWWQTTRETYSVRANVHVSGEVYRKFGTHYDTRLLVIDKPLAGQAPSIEPAVTGSVETVAELPALLEGVRNERTRTRTPTPGEVVESTSVEPQGGGVAADATRLSQSLGTPIL